MKKLHVLLIGTVLMTQVACVKQTQTTIVNPGTNPLDSPIINPTTTPFLNVQGTINGETWIDKGEYRGIKSQTTLCMHWHSLPIPYNTVNVEIYIYDAGFHTNQLVKVVQNVEDTFYNVLLTTNDYRITSTSPGWLTATFTPLTGSGKQAVTLTADLYR